MSLDLETANKRVQIVRQNSITYNFNIIVEAEKYYGLAEIIFYIENLDFEILELDFTGKLVEEVVINSVRVTPKTTDNFMLLKKVNLQKGRNKLSIMYTNVYDKDRLGCITFFDDGQQYVYTNFEPYGAHRVFPCFDQPNLKAKMKIAVVTPSQWIAVSNQEAT